MITLLALLAAPMGCYRDTTITALDVSYANEVKWKSYLKVRTADPSEEIDTTQTQISNVSPELAIAKVNQALESADADLGYRLSTVFQIAENNFAYAVTGMVVDGHYYYVAMLDYPPGNETHAAFEQTKGTIPAVAVVDAEDETKPAWIRTADAKGVPYAIMLRFTAQANWDNGTIEWYLRNHGYRYGIIGCNRLENPTLEMDDDWRPYFTVSYEQDDACGGTIGTFYYPTKLLVVDAQDDDIKEYALDNPNTTDADERSKDVPAWVDQVYSPNLALDWIDQWGQNTDNYGKTSELNEFQADGKHVDQVMSGDNTHLVFVSYMTSMHVDDSVIGVMVFDPRVGTATFYNAQGSKRAMATKTAAINAIKQATHRWDYGVDDLTLHTIFGVHTWEGVLSRPAVNNNGHELGSVYAGTVLLKADADVKPANVMWATSKHEAFTKYEQHLYLSQTERVGSNALTDSEISGTIDRVTPIVVQGDTNYLVQLEGHPGETWDVQIGYIGDPRTEDILLAQTGAKVHLRYGDPHNRKTYFTREVTLLPETPAGE